MNQGYGGYNQGGYNSGYGGQDFNQGYDQMGGMDMNQFKKNPNANSTPIKTSVGTEEIREIVQRLNAKPFNENYTLVSFDELSTLELLELLNKILTHLDPKNNVSIKDEPQEQTAVRISNFLQVLGYPSNFELPFQKSLVSGDKKTIYPILFYLMTRLNELQKRAYLAKFLVPIQVPEEFLADEEMKNQYQGYKELQAEFQAQHQQLEGFQKEAMAPNEIKKEINQLEQEKDQLIAKINLFKNKNTNKPEFQSLLEATNLLRKEQEEEARLGEKLRMQRQQLEWTEQQSLSSQQRLMDAKKSLSIENTPEQMLAGLRSEVKKNRDLCNNRLAFEIDEKKKKLDQIEQLLSEPPVPQSELNKLENTVIMLRRAVQTLEDKLAKEVNPDEDKLAIYKKQANLVARKKEKALEDIKRVEEEKADLEKEIHKKEQEIQRVRGPGYKSADDFKQYAANLRDKTTKFKKLKDELKDIKAESSILQRTEAIVKQKKDEYDAQLKQVEQKLGLTGYTDTVNKLEEISEKKEGIDEQKGKTLEEISTIVAQLTAKIQAMRSKLAPLMKDLKDLREQYKQTETVYSQKKAEYDQTFAGIESENATLGDEVKKIKEEAYKEDTKLQTMKYQTQVVELQTARLEEEAEYVSGKKQLSKEHKSYRDYLQAQIKEQENNLKEIKKKRDTVKEGYEPSLRQTAMLKDLKQLLELKLTVAKNEMNGTKSGGLGGRRHEESQGNVNRLVVRE